MTSLGGCTALRGIWAPRTTSSPFKWSDRSSTALREGLAKEASVATLLGRVDRAFKEKPERIGHPAQAALMLVLDLRLDEGARGLEGEVDEAGDA